MNRTICYLIFLIVLEINFFKFSFNLWSLLLDKVSIKSNDVSPADLSAFLGSFGLSLPVVERGGNPCGPGWPPLPVFMLPVSMLPVSILPVGPPPPVLGGIVLPSHWLAPPHPA